MITDTPMSKNDQIRQYQSFIHQKALNQSKTGIYPKLLSDGKSPAELGYSLDDWQSFMTVLQTSLSKEEAFEQTGSIHQIILSHYEEPLSDFLRAYAKKVVNNG